ncbi:hypothetical protein TeGR_g6934 [Tetraparma gracilis]|uniref:Antifreeze protein n=1 Tax=Tetraparma gracilis TaxID=2962635 RepID=A0ABQ6MYJ0_9STRA|nr:hypothetical protein TeGR_g6934 [Tetraparma gracilis]
MKFALLALLAVATRTNAGTDCAVGTSYDFADSGCDTMSAALVDAITADACASDSEACLTTALTQTAMGCEYTATMGACAAASCSSDAVEAYQTALDAQLAGIEGSTGTFTCTGAAGRTAVGVAAAAAAATVAAFL